MTQMNGSWLRYCDPTYFEHVDVRRSLRSYTVGESVVDCRLNNIRWVRVKDKDVAVLELEIRCTGPSKTQIESASLNLKFSQRRATNDADPLNVVECVPKQLTGQSSNKHIDRHAELSPKADVAGFGLELGSLGVATSMDKKLYWTFTTHPQPDKGSDLYRGIWMQAEVTDDSCYADLTAIPLHTIAAIEGVQSSVACSADIEIVMKRWLDKARVHGQENGSHTLSWYEVPISRQSAEAYPNMEELSHELKRVVDNLNITGERPRSKHSTILAEEVILLTSL